MTTISDLLPDPGQALSAIECVQAVIAFDPDGRVLAANDRFLSLTGYSLAEIAGQRHAMFLEPGAADRVDYTEFWADLRRGQAQQGEFCRIGKDGRAIWVAATYAPVRAADGRVERVVKFAIDITAAKESAALAAEQLRALSRSQAVIEFTPQGRVLTANDLFLKALDYQLGDIRGQHHAMFLAGNESETPEYRAFWDALRAGRPQTGEFRRIGRNGREVWIVASYNPMLDARGQVVRVVKYATDVTERKLAVRALITGLLRLAQGDLTVRIDQAIGGEFAEMRESFNKMVHDLGAMIGQVRNATREMRQQAQDIRTGAQDLAQRRTHQAESLDRTAAAVTQIADNIRLTSDSAQTANGVAGDARERASAGVGVVGQVVTAMERIENHTKQMSEITRVIENFAFQTNLLSINAAVEAARAGEVGRGFAVVAAEVRNLAQQSAKASQSIADLIEKSEADVRLGVSLVRDAGTTLAGINEAVEQVVGGIASVARTTTEQSRGVAEVSASLGQIDTITHQNMALSEQYAGSARVLSEQLETINALMEGFTIREHAHAWRSGRAA